MWIALGAVWIAASAALYLVLVRTAREPQRAECMECHRSECTDCPAIAAAAEPELRKAA